MSRTSSAFQNSSKYLRFTEDDFQGYWVQLDCLLRKNDDIDELLDGLLTNPFSEFLSKLKEPGVIDPMRPVSECLTAMYKDHERVGIPTAEEVDLDPVGTFKDLW